tara:strand:+ start:220358 stop:220801 length:444 start_codon:yes stop_codon:yes gene_type:complete
MVYRIRIKESAKPDFQFAKDYGLAERVVAWLNELAEEAEVRRGTKAIDFTDFLEDVAAIENVLTEPIAPSWKLSYRRFCKANFASKLRALLHCVRRQSAPWRIQATVTWFAGILGHLEAEVHVLYEVDHVNKQIIVLMFTGLPGQGQ